MTKLPEIPIAPTELGRRLRTARESAGMTQSEVADAVGVGRTTLVAIEKGKRRVTAEELLVFSDTFEVSVSRLLRPEAVHVELSPSFRKQVRYKKTASDEAAEALDSLNRLATAYSEVEALLGQAQRHEYPNIRYFRRASQRQQAEDLAMEARDRLGYGLHPITDLAATLEERWGFRIFIRGIGSSISGLFAFHPKLGPNVLLNAKHPSQRRNWTLAHELGHFLVDREGANVVLVNRQFPSSEQFTDHFAAAFLMPASGVRRDFHNYCSRTGKFSTRHLIYLANRYQVSPPAFTYRLESLGLLPNGTYEALRDREFGRELVESVLGGPIASPWTYVPRLRVLVLEALDQDLITEGQASELLGMDRVELRDLRLGAGQEVIMDFTEV